MNYSYMPIPPDDNDIEMTNTNDNGIEMTTTNNNDNNITTLLDKCTLNILNAIECFILIFFLLEIGLPLIVGFIYNVYFFPVFYLGFDGPSIYDICDNFYKMCDYYSVVSNLTVNNINIETNNCDIRFKLQSTYQYTTSSFNRTCYNLNVSYYSTYEDAKHQSDLTLGKENEIFIPYNSTKPCLLEYINYDPKKLLLDYCAIIFYVSSLLLILITIYFDENVRLGHNKNEICVLLFLVLFSTLCLILYISTVITTNTLFALFIG